MAQLKRVLLPTTLFVAVSLIVLAACGPSQAITEQPQSEFNQQKGEVEITSSDGHDSVITWETIENTCMVSIGPAGGSGGNFVLAAKPCTKETVVGSLEDMKEGLSPTAPSWQRETLDLAIAKLRR